MGWPYVWKIINNVITKSTTRILNRNSYMATKSYIWRVKRQELISFTLENWVQSHQTCSGLEGFFCQGRNKRGAAECSWYSIDSWVGDILIKLLKRSLNRSSQFRLKSNLMQQPRLVLCNGPVSVDGLRSSSTCVFFLLLFFRGHFLFRKWNDIQNWGFTVSDFNNVLLLLPQPQLQSLSLQKQ